MQNTRSVTELVTQDVVVNNSCASTSAVPTSSTNANNIVEKSPTTNDSEIVIEACNHDIIIISDVIEQDIQQELASDKAASTANEYEIELIVSSFNMKNTVLSILFFILLY